MKLEAHHPYLDCNIYLIFHKKMGRNMVSIRSSNDDYITTMSLARYNMSVYLGRILNSNEEVDHMDDDKLNDDISNLQILSGSDNRKKEWKRRNITINIELICPICGKSFMFRKSNLSTHSNPTCSKRCGGIKSHLTHNQ